MINTLHPTLSNSNQLLQITNPDLVTDVNPLSNSIKAIESSLQPMFATRLYYQDWVFKSFNQISHAIEEGKEFSNRQVAQLPVKVLQNHGLIDGCFKVEPYEIASNKTVHNALLKGWDPYYTILAPMHFDWTSSSKDRLKNFLDLIKEESFKKSRAIDRTELVILLNERTTAIEIERSPDFRRNITEKDLEALIEQYPIKVRILRAQWELALAQPEDGAPPQGSLLALKAMVHSTNMPGSERLIKKINEAGNHSDIQVPYGRIREALLRESGVKERVELLKQRKKTHYIVGMDADAKKLEDRDGKGLFYHLDRKISEDSSLGAVVFGYALDTQSSLTRLACKIDMNIREILLHFGFTPYLPEPMTALNAKYYGSMSYLRDGSHSNGHGSESLNLVHNLVDHLGTKFKVCFNSIDVVTTTQAERMHRGVSHKDGLELTTEKLELLKKLAQSHLKFPIARKRIYESLPARCTRYAIVWYRKDPRGTHKAIVDLNGNKIPFGRQGLKEIFEKYKKQAHREGCRNRLETLLERARILPDMDKNFSKCSVDEVIDKLYSIQSKERLLKQKFSHSKYKFEWLKSDFNAGDTAEVDPKLVPIGKEGLRQIFKNFRDQKKGNYDPLQDLLKVHSFRLSRPPFKMSVDQIIEELYKIPNFETVLHDRLQNCPYHFSWSESSSAPQNGADGKKIPQGRKGLKAVFESFRSKKTKCLDPLKTLLDSYDIQLNMGKPIYKCSVDEIVDQLYSQEHLEIELEKRFRPGIVMDSIEQFLQAYDFLSHLSKMLQNKPRLSLEDLQLASERWFEMNRRVLKNNRGNYKNTLSCAEQEEKKNCLNKVRKARLALDALGWKKEDRDRVEGVSFTISLLVSTMLINEISKR